MTENNKKILDLRRSSRSSKPKNAGGGSGDTAKKKPSAQHRTHTMRPGASRSKRTADSNAKQGAKPSGRFAQSAQKTTKPAQNTSRSHKKNKNELRIIPLGGLNEIGKNITAFEWRDDIIIVDCGMSFPEDEMFGIDVVIPDFDYLEKNSNRIRGLLVTHGHEDHIGAIPYLLKKVNAPIYATRLTIGLIESKLAEHGLRANISQINAGQKLKIGVFGIEAIRMTHSIADSLAFAIGTPVGTIFHTGDFKIDYTPVDGDPMDFQKLAEIGAKGVLLMLSDSTNAIRKGYTKSERHLNAVMDGIFRDTKSRIIVATFASNVHRIQTIINTAVRYGRKVTLSGRSMLKVLDLAMEMGYIHIPKNVLIDIDAIGKIPDDKLVIITTGSQGEPMSALTRMAAGDHRAVSIKRGDKIILSSSPIPGNEKTVSNIVNLLLERGADVVYSDIADIHVSGHACREELKIMLSLIRPKFFMPVHGEYRHLNEHALLAERLGTPKGNVFILENGSVLATDGKTMRITGEKVEAEPVFVDGLGVGDIGTIVLRDRKLLSESGLIIVIATLDSTTGRVISGPEIISRGFIYVRDNEDIIEDLRRIAANTLYEMEGKKKPDHTAMKNSVRDALKRSIFERTRRNPVILTLFMDA
jgi:ribonuclease J